jgi:hypothetical protein
MNRQGLIKLLQSNLSDEDVLEILEDLVCKNTNRSLKTDLYRPGYQPWISPMYKVTDAVGQDV